VRTFTLEDFLDQLRAGEERAAPERHRHDARHAKEVKDADIDDR